MICLQRLSCFLLFASIAIGAHAAAPTATFTASPTTGRAPLGVSFDASTSTNTQTVQWEFGDGTVSNATVVSHVYNVAGTYIARLTTKSATGESASSTVTITVTGSGEGPVTGNMNFRWATTASTFKLNHARANSDKFNLTAVFNTVDLPGALNGLAASFSINNTFTVNGIMGEEGGFQSPDKARPNFFVQVDPKEQVLLVEISSADLSRALQISGATNTTVASPGILLPVVLTLTVGAQTYQLTENYTYTSTSGGTGTGTFNLKKSRGEIRDGFFTVSRASALEDPEGDGHFYEFECLLSKPLAQVLNAPNSGTFRFKFNNADTVTVPFDRVLSNGSKITYEQSDRDLGGVKSLVVDAVTRRMTLRTWDINARENVGGSGLPLRAQSFTAFNFAVRLDFDQPDGTTFQVVTATRLTRRTQDDAFWQTGRRKKRQ